MHNIRGFVIREDFIRQLITRLNNDGYHNMSLFLKFVKINIIFVPNWKIAKKIN